MENHHPSTLLSMDSSASSHEELDLEMNNNRQSLLSGPPDINLPLSAEPRHGEHVHVGVQGEAENALGKMQLRSYMNGHSRQGDRLFPFSVEKGFVRSHRMQRKHYRGLSNPQCVHGIELIPSPNLACLDEEERKRWMELTGRDLNFAIPPEASDFGSWRNLPNTDFELERHPPALKNNNSKKLLNGSGLNLSTQPSNGEGTDLSPSSHKKRKDMFSNGINEEESCLPPAIEVHHNELPNWSNEFSGAMKNVHGPVTAAKTIYEDEEGYLIIITLPFVDLNSVKVSWRNTLTHGIIKVSCVSTSRVPFIKRHDRMFKLTDPASEHCPEENQLHNHI
ncbi:hypothetical protein Bca52824_049341 [Brassica carinata]|uniref:HSP20-like chaperones superfamily protein n=1 Tax=Brassica carinata TaxID=52824 RepID=A0A8X7RKP8_BRACI|nr:hypothetical protein Bca52824_049341 [Brassica carinata]